MPKKYHVDTKRTNRSQATLAIGGLVPETAIDAWQVLEIALTRLVEYDAHSFPGYGGLFVLSIEGVTPPPGFCWAVRVNGDRLEDHGVSTYVIQPGDRVEIKVEEIEAVVLA